MIIASESSVVNSAGEADLVYVVYNIEQDSSFKNGGNWTLAF